MNDLTCLAIFIVLLTTVWVVGCVIVDSLADERKGEDMPHSLRVRLGNLRYKGIISDKDYTRLCNALDLEKKIDDIKAEIETEYRDCDPMQGHDA